MNIFVPIEQSSTGDYEMDSVCRVCEGCVGVYLWLTLLTLQWIGHRCYIHWLIMSNLGQDDHGVCPRMSRDFDLHLTFDLDIGINTKFEVYIF